MDAANLFKKDQEEADKRKNYTPYLDAFRENWQKNHPNYKLRDILSLVIIFGLFLTIPLTVFVANQVRDNRSRASSGPVAVFEENFKKLDLKFAAKEQTLTLIKKVEDDTLPQPEIDKKDGKNIKALTFEVVQTSKTGQPVHTSSQDVTIKVNNKGEASAQDVYFSVQVLDEPGTVTISLSGKKLLGVGI